MQAFPHSYSVEAHNDFKDPSVVLQSAELPALRTAAPREFDGPGDQWSPETLLVGAVADCFILTFRSLAQFSKLGWISLKCAVEGKLDRIDRTTEFTAFCVRATLWISSETDREQAQRFLKRAEQMCLVSNSLKAPTSFEASVETVDQPVLADGEGA